MEDAKNNMEDAKNNKLPENILDVHTHEIWKTLKIIKCVLIDIRRVESVTASFAT